MEKEFYRKYRWFFTHSGKLVYGGKSAEQNEEVLKNLASKKEDFVIMHTMDPGSPFAVINAPIREISERDIEETATWTACFSRAWRSGKKKSVVDIFTKNQLYNNPKMKAGTWGVKGKIERKEVETKLVLINQKKFLRAVPINSPDEKDKVLFKIIPGKIPKDEFAKMISEKLKKPLDEVLNALPTGGFTK